jgi:tRNA (adenine37-N6)-methyltransferase
MLNLEPIGYVRTEKVQKFEAPSQPDQSSAEVNYIDLAPGENYDLALQDLATFDRIWLIWWFHKNENWRPRVMPPRGPAIRRGVFATRSPHRPNPIGLTNVLLVSVNGHTLTVGPLDLIDGTPIFDIKPYIPTIDSHPNSNHGWLNSLEDAKINYQINVSELAQSQLDWLKIHWEIDFSEKLFAILGGDPTPHRTRRITKMPDGHFRIGCGVWRVYFRISDNNVLIELIGNGYLTEQLLADGHEKIAYRDAQLDFNAQDW